MKPNNSVNSSKKKPLPNDKSIFGHDINHTGRRNCVCNIWRCQCNRITSCLIHAQFETWRWIGSFV